jgi:hypothetical protein
MKHSIPFQYKIFILIFGIIFLTYITPYLVEKVMEHRKEQEQKYRKRMGLDEPIVEGLLSAGDILKPIMGPINTIIGTVKSIGELVTQMVPVIFKGILQMLLNLIQLITGLPLLLTGMGQHFLCGGMEFKDGFTNGIQVFAVLLKCSLISFVNFFNGQCTIYYIIDIIFGTIYKIAVELPIVILKNVLGLDLQFIVDLIHDLVVIPVDTLIFGLSGYHITKWPDSVVSNCYKCKGKINGTELELQYYQWGSMFNCTSQEIMNGVYKMIYSVTPLGFLDNHWMTWAKGRHLDGWDDRTD